MAEARGKQPDKHRTDRFEAFIVRAPVGVRDHLSAVARRRGITRNDLVLLALERTLATQKADDESHREE